MTKKVREARTAEIGGQTLKEAEPAPEGAAVPEAAAASVPADAILSEAAAAPVPADAEEAAVPEAAAAPALSDADVARVDVDLVAIRRRLRETQLLVSPAAIATQATLVRQWMAKLQADGSWGDIAYSDQTAGSWKASDHLNRVLVMARLYSTSGHDLYKDAMLRGKILTALGLWLARDFQNPNWWHNQIGVPSAIGQILILIAPELAPDRVQKGITILHRGNVRPSTGANLTWFAGIQLLRGALTGVPEVVAGAIKAMTNELKIAGPDQEGVQADFSFHQHGALLYSGGYGQAFTGDCARFAIYGHGTRYAIPAERFAILAGHILDGQQWMMRGDTIDYGTIGRQIARPNQTGGPIVDTARRLAQIAVPRQKEFAALVARAEGKAPPLVGNRHFWKSDFMAHHRAGYYSSVRMVSTRTFNTDAFINNEARHGRHLADGATYIFRTGEEYHDIFPVWDWRRVPGVTCEQRPEPLDLNGLNTRGQTSFVGGVSDGLYGLAAMDLRRDSMAVKKAWFYFDDQFVCLGAGLTNPTEHPVYTSVNQCLHQGLVRIAGPSMWSSSPGPGEYWLRARGWVHHDQIGYFFPAGLTVRISSGLRTGRWSDIGAGPPDPVTKDVFSIWIDHGPRAAGKSFHYIVYPNIDWQKLIAPTPRPSAKILSNTPTLQAVQHLGARICGAVFYQPGALAGGPGWNIAVDRPCLLLVRARAEGVQLAVANPENQPLTVNVDLDRALVGEGCTPISPGRTRIAVKLPEGTNAGQSVVRLLKPR